MRATTTEQAPPEERLRQSGDVRTLVVDDQGSFRDALRHLIAATPGFHLVGEAASGEDALTAVDELSPQLVLMDVRMPGMGGIQAALALAGSHPEVMVILISVHGSEDLPSDLVDGSHAAAFAHKEKLRPRLLRELWQEHRTEGHLSQ
jgi:two-component system invasion response regulator UvrY